MCRRERRAAHISAMWSSLDAPVKMTFPSLGYQVELGQLNDTASPRHYPRGISLAGLRRIEEDAMPEDRERRNENEEDIVGRADEQDDDAEDFEDMEEDDEEDVES
jgi:hypothetical protein